jgi:hypothetical protein
MKLNLLASFTFGLLASTSVFAQPASTTPAPPPPPAPAIGITWGGYAKLDWGIDTRATTNLREGHFSMYPVAASLDKNGKDINATPIATMLAVQTRLNAKIVGPDFMGGKTSGLIEGEFFGTADGDINGFRLRHAWMKTTWAKSELMLGQGWHPMFVAECFPGVYNFNTGVPFQPFNRSPQIRYTLMPSKSVKVILAALGQRDFQSIGPAGQATTYQKLAVVPNLHAQLQVNAGKTLFGIGVDEKWLRPRNTTIKGYATDTKVASTAFIGYVKYTASPAFSVKLEGTYGGNLTDHLMLGGYAETSVDSTRGYTYEPINVFAGWLEIAGMSGNWEYGLFAGYTKDLGASESLTAKGATTWGRAVGTGTNGAIDNVMRIAPRIGLKQGKMTIGLEFEYTVAQYGSDNITDKLKVKTTDAAGKTIDPVSNFRVMLTGIYAF